MVPPGNMALVITLKDAVASGACENGIVEWMDAHQLAFPITAGEVWQLWLSERNGWVWHIVEFCVKLEKFRTAPPPEPAEADVNF